MNRRSFIKRVGVAIGVAVGLKQGEAKAKPVTDNRIERLDGKTGELIQGSPKTRPSQPRVTATEILDKYPDLIIEEHWPRGMSILTPDANTAVYFSSPKGKIL